MYIEHFNKSVNFLFSIDIGNDFFHDAFQEITNTTFIIAFEMYLDKRLPAYKDEVCGHTTWQI